MGGHLLSVIRAVQPPGQRLVDYGNVAQSFWTKTGNAGEDYIVARYIPELSWQLIVERDTGILVTELRRQLYRTAVIIACIITTILFVITYVIRGFNRQITRLTRRDVPKRDRGAVRQHLRMRAHIERLLALDPNRTYGFIILDIDNFKDANDRHGHVFGDSVIVAFSETIRRCFREDDVVGRIGGDEFVVFVPIPNEIWIKQKVEALCAALSQAHTMDAKTWQMSASIGIARSPAGGSDFDSLYRHADTALYRTKKRGKGGYSLYEP